MRTALGQWHMGRVIAAYRNHPHHGRPLRQETVAVWVGVTQPQLSRIKNGPAVSDLGKLIQWAWVLDIPPGLLWFQVPQERTHQPQHLAPAPPPRRPRRWFLSVWPFLRSRWRGSSPR
ncbi:MAG TPA: helix-turn-helix transcriptional regulator [Nonomuraea sp.]|nr:helix-turn-helix transcriptional regulator [Nonomuraea sp.]